MKPKFLWIRPFLLILLFAILFQGCDRVKEWVNLASHVESKSDKSEKSKSGDPHDDDADDDDSDDDSDDDDADDGAARHANADKSHEGHEGEEHAEHLHKVIVTQPVRKDVVSTQSYVCQIHSCRHIELRALESGYLEEISVKEGQFVHQGDSLFRVIPALYQAKLETEMAEAKLVEIEYNNAQKLFEQNVVSAQEVALAQAKVAKAQAQVRLSKAELDFANVKAPFNGIINRLLCQQGSLVSEGDVLTTLSDNSLMWVYFNVPEARYLEYKTSIEGRDHNLEIDLILADHSKFDQPGAIGAIAAEFNNETGNIAFRADFQNPNGLLRHGQTGNILLHRPLAGAIVIPQRATFEILAKRFVFVVDKDNVAHQREIEIQSEMDDIFIIGHGIDADENIILEGVRQVRDGEKIEFEFRDSAEVLGNLKNKAE